MQVGLDNFYLNIYGINKFEEYLNKYNILIREVKYPLSLVDIVVMILKHKYAKSIKGVF